MKLKRSEIREDRLTLEDVALLEDEAGQVPPDTLSRVRAVIRSTEELAPHYRYLGALAEAAGMPETSDRLYVGLRCLEELERLAQAEGWRHPAEVLDPEGESGIQYAELVNLARTRARQAEEPGRYRQLERRLERAWAVEKAADELTETFAARLCDYQPAVAERLLRQAMRQYRARRRRPVQAREAMS